MPIHRGIKQCSYVRHNGRRCGSPVCLSNRGQDRDRCYHHDRQRYPDPLIITPQLREVADVFADPNFHQHLEDLSERLNNGYSSIQELEMTLTTILGFEIRSIKSAADAERRLCGIEDSQTNCHSEERRDEESAFMVSSRAQHSGVEGPFVSSASSASSAVKASGFSR